MIKKKFKNRLARQDRIYVLCVGNIYEIGQDVWWQYEELKAPTISNVYNRSNECNVKYIASNKPKENVTQNPTEHFSIFQGQGLHCFASVLMLYNGLTKHDLKGY